MDTRKRKLRILHGRMRELERQALRDAALEDDKPRFIRRDESTGINVYSMGREYYLNAAAQLRAIRQDTANRILLNRKQLNRKQL